MNPVQLIDNKKTYTCIALWTLIQIAGTQGWIPYEIVEPLSYAVTGGGLASLKHSWDKKHKQSNGVN